MGLTAAFFYIVLSVVHLLFMAHGGYISVSNNRLVHGSHRVFLSGANTAWVDYGMDFGNHQYPANRHVFQQMLRNLDGLIRDDDKLQSYIDNALIPWVRSVKDHPALGGWDIINEMEGVIMINLTDSDPCFDTHFLSPQHSSWAGSFYTPRQLLKFINWQADAIRTADPAAMTTAGSWAQGTQSDLFGDHNLYKDDCLVKAGGKPNGVLTFYSTHAYVHPNYETHWAPDSVFKHSRSDYKLDKPLMVAEFNQQMGGGMTSVEMFTYVYNHSYDGAWSWQMRPGGASDKVETQLRGIASLAGRDGVAINLTNPY
nr:hypothetical protein BaRGS_012283 [Batillaria attramentaria]